MSSDRVHLSVDDARALGEGALRGIGYDAEEAWIIADHVIDAALCGYEYSGLAKLLNIPEHSRFRLPRRPMHIVHETPVSALYDGGNNVGMVAMYHAANAAIAKAAAHGIAVIGVTDSWMSGRSAYFVEMIAKADLVAIHTASSGGAVAPHGGTRPVLGTNPIAFAIPGAEGPLVLDMGTSAFMATELQLRARLGQELPEGVALDRDLDPARPQPRPIRHVEGNSLIIVQNADAHWCSPLPPVECSQDVIASGATQSRAGCAQPIGIAASLRSSQ